ncbi:MAG: poly-gamma-glutamate system protein [Spirochaetia bacterium]|nr:poly-gamma-glutamate system protein [Spirochaetia bacterium]
MLYNPVRGSIFLSSPGSRWPFLLLCSFLIVWALLVSWLSGLLPVDQAAVEAAGVQTRVIQAVSQEAVNRGLSIDLESDRHGTGLIGEVLTGLTSTQGNLPAKRTAATPDVAALLVALLREAGVGEGSLVAVNASGSFPGFALAAVSACGALGADAVMVLSVGSSSWGANRPEFTILEMFMAAMDAGAWPPGYPAEIAALSPGGSDDRGLDLDPEALESALDRAESLGIAVLRPQTLDEAVSLRMTLYRAGGEPDVLLTIGGNYAATGADPTLALLSGVIRPVELGRLGQVGSSGLVQDFLRAGLPVIQVLNIKELSTRYGLPHDPVVVPAIGKAGVYRHELNSNGHSGARLGFLVLALLPVAGAILVFARYRRRIDESWSRRRDAGWVYPEDHRSAGHNHC